MPEGNFLDSRMLLRSNKMHVDALGSKLEY